jgi:spermidine synthase
VFNQVLVVGGGDGGVLREIAKHPGIQEIHLCEIDKVCYSLAVLFTLYPHNRSALFSVQMVVEASKKYLPTISCGFNDPRVKVHIRDGFEFMKEHKNEFDVIITDSSDPDGTNLCFWTLICASNAKYSFLLLQDPPAHCSAKRISS